MASTSPPPEEDDLYDLPALRVHLDITAEPDQAEALCNVVDVKDDEFALERSVNALIHVQELMHWLEPNELYTIQLMVQQRLADFERFKKTPQK